MKLKQNEPDEPDETEINSKSALLDVLLLREGQNIINLLMFIER